jgi:predicted fused transcriptional regulator/phosphomethylpyrimidine kinase
MVNMKQTEKIVGAIRKVFNSTEMQERFKNEFTAMSPEVKMNLVMVMLYKLCENNKELMDIVASEMYEELKAL